jgi:hypothetical protein
MSIYFLKILFSNRFDILLLRFVLIKRLLIRLTYTDGNKIQLNGKENLKSCKNCLIYYGYKTPRISETRN